MEETMTTEILRATTTINAPAEAVFAVLANPARHAAIDGTGWVQAPLDPELIQASGQVFRMAMYHPNHPNGHYEMFNRVEVFDPPHAISWKPGYDTGDGKVRFGGWAWCYNLAESEPSQTEVTLTYDWSAVPEDTRRQGNFPPFSPDHLDNSLDHLAQLVIS
jgi:uncharacterized protein YndB with AHSA1/START domain